MDLKIELKDLTEAQALAIETFFAYGRTYSKQGGKFNALFFEKGMDNVTVNDKEPELYSMTGDVYAGYDIIYSTKLKNDNGIVDSNIRITHINPKEIEDDLKFKENK
jgi:hypothetical protein